MGTSAIARRELGLTRKFEKASPSTSDEAPKTADTMEHDHVSLAETVSTGSSCFGMTEPVRLDGTLENSCDACPDCDDCCENDHCTFCHKAGSIISCKPCTSGLLSSQALRPEDRYYTLCQVRRHNHEGSAWLVVGSEIYDATPYLRSHPGGTESILRKAGGARDCTEDLLFHSKAAQKMWRKYKIGNVAPCRRVTSGAARKSVDVSVEKPWWMFWTAPTR